MNMPRIRWCEIKGWKQPTKSSNWLANIRKYLKGFSSYVSAGGRTQQIHRPTPQTKQCASICVCNTLPRLGTSCLATVFILFYPCLYILNVLTALCCLVTASKCVWAIIVTAAKFLRALLILELVQPALTDVNDMAQVNTRDVLLALQLQENHIPPSLLEDVILVLLITKRRPHRRGGRGGVRYRVGQWCNRPPLPSIIPRRGP